MLQCSYKNWIQFFVSAYGHFYIQQRSHKSRDLPSTVPYTIKNTSALLLKVLSQTLPLFKSRLEFDLWVHFWALFLLTRLAAWKFFSFPITFTTWECPYHTSHHTAFTFYIFIFQNFNWRETIARCNATRKEINKKRKTNEPKLYIYIYI